VSHLPQVPQPTKLTSRDCLAVSCRRRWHCILTALLSCSTSRPEPSSATSSSASRHGRRPTSNTTRVSLYTCATSPILHPTPLLRCTLPKSPSFLETWGQTLSSAAAVHLRRRLPTWPAYKGTSVAGDILLLNNTIKPYTYNWARLEFIKSFRINGILPTS
jgi:hypothetical protein